MLVLSLKKHLTLKTFLTLKTDLVRLLYKFIASQKRPHYDTFIRIRAYKNLELGCADAKKIDGVKRRLPRCYFHMLRAVASKLKNTTYVRVLEHHNDCNYGDSNSSHCRSNIAGTKTEKELHMASRAKYLWEMAALKQRCYELSNEGDQAPKMTLPCAKS